MSFQIKLWQVQGTKLESIPQTVLNDEDRLEEWVAKDPSILGIELLLIGRQVTTENRGRIDLLAIDSNGNLVVLELKRDRTPREVVAQGLDYASWIKNLSYDTIAAIAQGYCKKPLKDAFTEKFGSQLPEVVNGSHSIIILASQLDDSSERIVEYLAEEYDVPINVLFFTFFKNFTGEFVGRAWLKDPEEFQEQTHSKKQAPWSGFYFVNVGEGPHRNWDDCVKYGFIAAGQGETYSNSLRKLQKGDSIFAYMKGIGYVGFGVVQLPAAMVQDFFDAKSGKPLLTLPLKQPNISENKDVPELSEWVVAVEWKKVFEREDAKRYQGIFANQNIVCKLRDPATVDFLKTQFAVKP